MNLEKSLLVSIVVLFAEASRIEGENFVLNKKSQLKRGDGQTFRFMLSVAIWCYLCDSSSTGVATTIPNGNQRQADCSSSDPALLEKFVYNCDSYSTLFNSCETAFGFAADGKTGEPIPLPLWKPSDRISVLQ